MVESLRGEDSPIVQHLVPSFIIPFFLLTDNSNDYPTLNTSSIKLEELPSSLFNNDTDTTPSTSSGFMQQSFETIPPGPWLAPNDIKLEEMDQIEEMVKLEEMNNVMKASDVLRAMAERSESGLSMSDACMPGPSTSTIMPGPSTSTTMPGPSTSTIMPGPTMIEIEQKQLREQARSLLHIDTSQIQVAARADQVTND